MQVSKPLLYPAYGDFYKNVDTKERLVVKDKDRKVNSNLIPHNSNITSY